MRISLHSYFLLIILFSFSSKLSAQRDTISKSNNNDLLEYKAKRFTENVNKDDNIDFNYKESNSSKFKFPILYLDYKIAKKSFLSGGIEFCLNPKNENNLFLGAGYGITNSYNGNYYGLPDIHLSYNTNRIWFYKGGVSTKHAYVVFGPTFLNLIDLGLGYSQPFSENKTPEIKGFIFNTTLRLTSVPKSVPYQKRIIP